MARQTGVNLDIGINADGYDIAGGTTSRKLVVTGADITLTGSGSNVYTFPASSDTLVGRKSTDTLKNKTLTSPVLNTSLSGTAIKDEDDMVSNSATHVATQQSIKAYVDAAIVATKSALYPVGSIYVNATSSTNPGTLLGFGTWTAFGAGRVLVGLNSSDTDFDTAEETGGAKTHTLDTNEMPSHTHEQYEHDHSVSALWASAAGTTGRITRGNITTSYTGPGDITIEGSTAVNKDTGGGQAHNNLQPYIVVYMWKRTA